MRSVPGAVATGSNLRHSRVCAEDNPVATAPGTDLMDRRLSEGRIEMSQTTESKNKALVLEAFDTLFNKRDHAGAERYWSPDYVQHSAHIEPGREGLFNL